MAEILGIEPRLRVSKTPLLPLQYISIKWCGLLDSNQLLVVFSDTWAPASPKPHKMFDNAYGWLTHSAQCKVVGLWTRYTSSMCRKILETKTHTLSKMVGMVGLEPTEFSFWMKYGYPVTSHGHKIFDLVSIIVCGILPKHLLAILHEELDYRHFQIKLVL